MKRNDSRDWFVMVLFAAIWTAGTIWIFKNPSREAFGIWAGLFATLGGVYHWLTIHDDKIEDKRP